jgi:rfaE bifunctional protein nucleotidyltransferase chain/domain
VNTQSKIITSENLGSVLDNLPRPLVFTNGCFDILHRGHTTYLEQARNLGATLIVGVNSDESVRKQNKGTDRPYNCLADRMSVLASLACVDGVISFAEDTPFNLIQQIMPDHLVKGGDWAIADIVGADIVQDNGGTVHSIPFEYDRSTTDLVRRIQKT